MRRLKAYRSRNTGGVSEKGKKQARAQRWSKMSRDERRPIIKANIEARGKKLSAAHNAKKKKKVTSAAQQRFVASRSGAATAPKKTSIVNIVGKGERLPLLRSKEQKKEKLRRIENTNPLTGKLSALGKRRIEKRMKAGVATKLEKGTRDKSVAASREDVRKIKKGKEAYFSVMRGIFGKKKKKAATKSKKGTY